MTSYALWMGACPMVKETEGSADGGLDAPEFHGDLEAEKFPGVATANDRAESEVDRRRP